MAWKLFKVDRRNFSLLFCQYSLLSPQLLFIFMSLFYFYWWLYSLKYTYLVRNIVVLEVPRTRRTEVKAKGRRATARTSQPQAGRGLES